MGKILTGSLILGKVSPEGSWTMHICCLCSLSSMSPALGKVPQFPSPILCGGVMSSRIFPPLEQGVYTWSNLCCNIFFTLEFESWREKLKYQKEMKLIFPVVIPGKACPYVIARKLELLAFLYFLKVLPLPLWAIPSF